MTESAPPTPITPAPAPSAPPTPNVDDPRLDPATRAFARGDFASARLHLASAPPATQAALRRALGLDPMILATGAALLALWATVFFSTV